MRTCTATPRAHPARVRSCALVLGAVLIAVADEPTRTAIGYFFQHPTTRFSSGWHAIASAYSALFEGSIFNTDSLYSQRRGPRCSDRSRTP